MADEAISTVRELEIVTAFFKGLAINRIQKTEYRKQNTEDRGKKTEKSDF